MKGPGGEGGEGGVLAGAVKAPQTIFTTGKGGGENQSDEPGALDF